jgi:hypothetical protein
VESNTTKNGDEKKKVFQRKEISVQVQRFMALTPEAKINFIFQLRIFLSSIRAPCLMVLGYLIDCQRSFKVLERIESVLKIIYFHIS